MTKMNELTAAAEFLNRKFPHGGRVLCAVSGGLDSMCLLDYMTPVSYTHLRAHET